MLYFLMHGNSMISTRVAQELASYIALFLGYLIAITPAGWARAWIASYMGDDTGEQLDLKTLNPFAHVDTMGVIILLLPFFRVGWGKDVPVHFSAMHSHHPRLAFATVLFSNTFVHWIVATLSLVMLTALVGSKAIFTCAADISSLHLAYTRVLCECIRLSVWLALISFIINLIHYYIAVYLPNLYQEQLMSWYYIFAYLIISLTAGQTIHYFIWNASIVASQFIAHALGIR